MFNLQNINFEAINCDVNIFQNTRVPKYQSNEEQDDLITAFFQDLLSDLIDLNPNSISLCNFEQKFATIMNNRNEISEISRQSSNLIESPLTRNITINTPTCSNNVKNIDSAIITELCSSTEFTFENTEQKPGRLPNLDYTLNLNELVESCSKDIINYQKSEKLKFFLTMPTYDNLIELPSQQFIEQVNELSSTNVSFRELLENNINDDTNDKIEIDQFGAVRTEEIFNQTEPNEYADSIEQTENNVYRILDCASSNRNNTNQSSELSLKSSNEKQVTMTLLKNDINSFPSLQNIYKNANKRALVKRTNTSGRNQQLLQKYGHIVEILKLIKKQMNSKESKQKTLKRDVETLVTKSDLKMNAKFSTTNNSKLKFDKKKIVVANNAKINTKKNQAHDKCVEKQYVAKRVEIRTDPTMSGDSRKRHVKLIVTEHHNIGDKKPNVKDTKLKQQNFIDETTVCRLRTIFEKLTDIPKVMVTSKTINDQDKEILIKSVPQIINDILDTNKDRDIETNKIDINTKNNSETSQSLQEITSASDDNQENANSLKYITSEMRMFASVTPEIFIPITAEYTKQKQQNGATEVRPINWTTSQMLARDKPKQIPLLKSLPNVPRATQQISILTFRDILKLKMLANMLNAFFWRSGRKFDTIIPFTIKYLYDKGIVLTKQQQNTWKTYNSKNLQVSPHVNHELLPWWMNHHHHHHHQRCNTPPTVNLPMRQNARTSQRIDVQEQLNIQHLKLLNNKNYGKNNKHPLNMDSWFESFVEKTFTNNLITCNDYLQTAIVNYKASGDNKPRQIISNNQLNEELKQSSQSIKLDDLNDLNDDATVDSEYCKSKVDVNCSESKIKLPDSNYKCQKTGSLLLLKQMMENC